MSKMERYEANIREVCKALCKTHGTGQCAPLCLQHLALSTTDGRCPESEKIWSYKVKALLEGRLKERRVRRSGVGRLLA